MSLLYHLDHPLQRFDALLEKTVGGSLGKKAVGKSSPKFFRVTDPDTLLRQVIEKRADHLSQPILSFSLWCVIC